MAQAQTQKDTFISLTLQISSREYPWGDEPKGERKWGFKLPRDVKLDTLQGTLLTLLKEGLGQCEKEMLEMENAQEENAQEEKEE